MSQFGDESRWSEDPRAQDERKLTTIEIRYAIDDVVLRTVAKISFNYLAKVTEDRVPGFVLRTEFDAVRSFIRYGEKPEWAVVTISAKPMLLGDSRQYRITRGHLVSASWPDPTKPPIGKVSLFNEILYVVRFAHDAPGIWWELDSGHHFDIKRKEVRRIGSVNPILLRGSGFRPS